MFSRRKGEGDLVTRYEAKYAITREVVPQIRAFIQPFCQPDPHTQGDPPTYRITTLQLEDPWYSLHNAKEFGAVSRFKLRVRTYGEIGSSPIFPEIKAKLEETIVKTRTVVPFNAWSRELVMGVELPDIFKNEKQEIDFLHFKRLTWEIGAEPKTLVRYLRESYVGTLDSYARITFDTQLQYQMTRSWSDFGRSGLWRNMDSTEAQGFGLPWSSVILEVKTLSYMPLWVIDMVERFQLHKRGNCKYSTAIWRDSLFRRYPDTNSATEEFLAMAH